MSRSFARIVTAAVLLLGSGSAGAETVYNQDGVRLSATTQEIDPGAATCRIREERHTAEQYEKLKPNDDQPLDVWRIEVLVANYSGKALDYLNAHVNVESSWPPCDHWDGPEAHYGAPVVWTGPLMSIQDVGTVEPGEELRETAFVLAWHEEEPTLGRWDINYDFAAAPRAGTASSTAESRPESAAAGSAAVTDADTFAAERSDPAAGIRPDDTCAGKAVGASCWMEVANQPGCYAWNPNLQKGETVTWTGDCSGGRASGTGERTWNYTNRQGEAAWSSGTGELRNDKRAGHWVVRSMSGVVAEGPFVGGKEQGRFVIRYPDGDIQEGPYVDGKMNGRWVERDADGDVEEGPYVNGEKHGHWVIRRASGAVEEGPYVDGKRHGRWIDREADGGVWEWEYVEGSLEDGRPLDR